DRRLGTPAGRDQPFQRVVLFLSQLSSVQGDTHCHLISDEIELCYRSAAVGTCHGMGRHGCTLAITPDAFIEACAIRARINSSYASFPGSSNSVRIWRRTALVTSPVLGFSHT